MKKVLIFSLILLGMTVCSCCTENVTQSKYERFSSKYNAEERAEVIYLLGVVQEQRENGIVSEKGIEAFEYFIRMKGGVE